MEDAAINAGGAEVSVNVFIIYPINHQHLSVVGCTAELGSRVPSLAPPHAGGAKVVIWGVSGQIPRGHLKH